VTETPSVEDVPSIDEIAPAYETLLELASVLLTGPISTHVRSWEDGEYDVRVWHKYGSPDPDRFRKEVLRIHSEEDDVTAGVLEVHYETDDERLLYSTDIDPDEVTANATPIRHRVEDE
jgi:hypothetical protein